MLRACELIYILFSVQGTKPTKITLKILVATVQNLVARANWRPTFLHPWVKGVFYKHGIALLVKKFPDFYESRIFLTLFAQTHLWYPS
jgi:hypothetical protein